MELKLLERQMRKNSLMLVVLSYLFMPYPFKPGIPAFCSFVVFAVCCYFLWHPQRKSIDRYIGWGILLFFCYDFLFVTSPGFNFSFFRAYSFGLLTFAAVVATSNFVSLDRMIKGLYIWFLLSILISLSQNVAGEFFFIPLWFNYFGKISECSLFNFCLITTPVGFNIAKTQFALQIAFFVPMMLTLCLCGIFKKSHRLIILVVMAILLIVTFSRSAWVAVFVALLFLLSVKFSEYYKVIFTFVAVSLLIFVAISFEERSFNCTYNCSDEGGAQQGINAKTYRVANPVNAASPKSIASPESTALPEIVVSYSTKDIVSQHGFSGVDHSSKMRLKLARIGLDLLAKFPWGGGSGFFHKNYYDRAKFLYPAEVTSGKKSRIGPHNTYFLILAEKGVVGLLLFVFVSGRVGFLLWRKYKTEENYYALSVLTGFVGLLVYSGAHDTLTDRVFWIGLGLAVELACRQCSSHENNDNDVVVV